MHTTCQAVRSLCLCWVPEQVALESTLPQQTLLFCMTVIGIHRSISKLWYVYYCEPFGKVCVWAKRPIKLVFISSFSSMKRLGVFLLLPGWDAKLYVVHHRVILNFNFPSNHLYSWVERGTGRVIKGVLPKNTTQCPSRDFSKNQKVPFMLNSTLQEGFLGYTFCFEVLIGQDNELDR